MSRRTRPTTPLVGSTLPWMMSALDALPRNVALLDARGIIVAVNSAWQRFAIENPTQDGQLAHQTGVGVDYLALCDAARGPWAEGATEAAAGIRAVLTRHVSSHEQDYPCHSPERQRWFTMTVLPLDHPEAAALVIHTDITERRQEEVRRHDSELRLQLALDATGDGLWEFNPITGQVYLSPGYYAITGYRSEDKQPTREFFQRLVHPDDLDGLVRAESACLGGEVPHVDVEFRMISASGAIRWIRGRGRVVERDATGASLRMLGLITDVTAYKHIEQALQASEARYRSVVEDQTELISRIAVDGTFLFANEVYCRFFGKSVGEVIGTKWQPVAHVDDLPMILARLAELSPRTPVVVIENRVYAGDGSLRWMQFVNRGFFDAAGRLLEIQSVGRDITERRVLEARQRDLLDANRRLTRELIRLQEKERAALAKELHDELSQQLVAIRAYAGAIERRAVKPGDKSVLDAQAISGAARDIYSISHRLMEGLHPQVLASAGLVAAISSLATHWSRAQPETRVRVRAAAIGPCGAEASINAYRVVQECLANTLRHGRARRVRVFVGERHDGPLRRLRVVVRDDGIGMEVDAPRAGFGLLVMRERASALGGTLDIRSAPGRGMRVALDVPLADG